MWNPGKPIQSEVELDAAMQRIQELWGAPLGTPEGDELDVLLELVVAYEAAHHPDPKPVQSQAKP